ncbi:hypothetical protein DSECCO2_413250 [anaerobic digester metagenome]
MDLKTLIRAELQCPYIDKPGSEIITSDAISFYRDDSAFCARNLIGALVPECGRVFLALANGVPLSEVRRQALDGELFTQSARTTRERFWQTINYRYLRGPAWVVDDLCDAVREGERSPAFLSLLLIHYVLGDAITHRLVTGHVWDRWQSGERLLTRNDMVAELRALGEGHTRIERLTTSSLNRLAVMILGSLRDFGLLEGALTKRLVQPLPDDRAIAHLARILAAEGRRGQALVDDPAWQIFLLSPETVGHRLGMLPREIGLRFERVGSTVVLALPVGWETPP